MTEKHNESTYNRPEGERTIDSTFVHTDLEKHITQLKSEHAWQKNDRNAITVFKTDNLTIVLTAMHTGAKLVKENALEVMTVQVLEGSLLFHAEEKSTELTTGQLSVLHRGQYYSIEAKEDVVFLLSLYGDKQ